jgi:2-methylisocitrate lyase-like PEP mutase family enzyme
MPGPSQAEKAERFRQLHNGPRTLVLPNVWDAASARIIEEAGYPAIATTSAGIANALGYPDGERISRLEMLVMVARIAAATSVPVTADMEGGYGKRPEDMAETARALIASGAIGMNLEDARDEDPATLADLSLQIEKIKALKETSASLGVALVLNARTDIYLAGVGDPATRFQCTVERLNAYRHAGADCLFVPGVKDREMIAKLVKEVDGPLNILAVAGTPPIAELERLGVARVSCGSGPMRATLGLLRRIAKQLREEGGYSLMTEGAIPYAEANQLFENKK